MRRPKIQRLVDKIFRRKNAVAKSAKDGSYDPEEALSNTKKAPRLNVDHKRSAHIMVKIIAMTPMAHILKDIMTLRLLGIPPVYSPMTTGQVALYVGMPEHDIIMMEMEGKAAVSAHLKKQSAEDLVAKFNRNSRIQRDTKNKIEQNSP